jgi:hypothetical protein
MMEPMKIRERYMNDTHFHALVTMMMSEIERARFTPTEIREAAMLAQIMYEETNPRPIVFSKKDVMEGLV